MNIKANKPKIKLKIYSGMDNLFAEGKESDRNTLRYVAADDVDRQTKKDTALYNTTIVILPNDVQNTVELNSKLINTGFAIIDGLLSIFPFISHIPLVERGKYKIYKSSIIWYKTIGMNIREAEFIGQASNSIIEIAMKDKESRMVGNFQLLPHKDLIYESKSLSGFVIHINDYRRIVYDRMNFLFVSFSDHGKLYSLWRCVDPQKGTIKGLAGGTIYTMNTARIQIVIPKYVIISKSEEVIQETEEIEEYDPESARALTMVTDLYNRADIYPQQVIMTTDYDVWQ